MVEVTMVRLRPGRWSLIVRDELRGAGAGAGAPSKWGDGDRDRRCQDLRGSFCGSIPRLWAWGGGGMREHTCGRL